MRDLARKADTARGALLRGVVVRPIKFAERAQWDALIVKHHYLGSARMVGETLRYVAEFEGRWVALLGWSTAALKCHPRDSWIGWAPVLRLQRLPFVANNARYLVLGDAPVPNLASRVLALCVRRLSSDWEALYGRPIVLVETFVDTRRFLGTCYKAAGWVAVGTTKGFSKNAGHYFHHGQPKTVFVRPLHRRACQWLRDPTPRKEVQTKVVPIKLSAAQAESLMDCLRGLPDPRKRRGIRHRKLSILAVSICAVLGGARSYAAIAEWGQRCSQNILKRLGCRFNPKTQRREAPSGPTIWRLLKSIDTEAVDRALGSWLAGLVTASGQAVAIDGKTVRGAEREDGTQVHLLSAFVQQQGVIVAQREVESKSNEIPSAELLLAPLELKGVVVTADAMHTQRQLAEFLVEDKGADYLFTVKDNQKQLREEIAVLDRLDKPAFQHQTVDKGHGRLETRSIWTSTELNSHVNFPHCGQVGCIDRIRQDIKRGTLKHERVYIITSLTPGKAGPQRLLALNRGHWGIENSSHHVRDFTFDEDRSTIRKGQGPRMMAILRNLVISVLHLLGRNNIAQVVRNLAASAHRALRVIGL
jgi:predicted transposase YbfD/YdcC